MRLRAYLDGFFKKRAVGNAGQRVAVRGIESGGRGGALSAAILLENCSERLGGKRADSQQETARRGRRAWGIFKQAPKALVDVVDFPLRIKDQDAFIHDVGMNCESTPGS